MKKLFVIIFAFFILPCFPASAEKIQFSSNFPIPAGKYNTINLYPQTAISPATNCPVGSMYSNASDLGKLYYCAPGATESKYDIISGIWSQNGNNLTLSDTTNPQNKKVGIGTDSPDFMLTLENDGGILSRSDALDTFTPVTTSGPGTRLMWLPERACLYAGYIDGSQWNNPTAQCGHQFIFGYNSQSRYSSILGGKDNKSFGWDYTILGGENNYSPTGLGDPSFILGGKNNKFSPVGNDDYVGGFIGGLDNTIQSEYGFIGGGSDNQTTGDQRRMNEYIAGGYHNKTNAAYQVIAGGGNNFADTFTTSYWWASFAVIQGGGQNTVKDYSVGAGRQNTVNATYSAASGGYLHTVSNSYSVISGGYNNTVSGQYSVIAGGNQNTVSGQYSAIAGGSNNNISANYSAIAGGSANIISGANSSIPGGSGNSVSGNYSLAAGKNVLLSTTSNRTFAWGNFASPTTITASDAFIIATGNVGIRTTNPSAMLEIAGNGSGDAYLNLTTNSSATPGNILTIANNRNIGVGLANANPTYILDFSSIGAWVDDTGFHPASSRKFKEQIHDLKSNTAETTLHAMTPVRFNYKIEPGREYLGFIAEDMPDLIASRDRRGITSLDIAGVLVRVVQQQQATLERQRIKSEGLLKELEKMEQQIKERTTDNKP